MITGIREAGDQELSVEVKLGVVLGLLLPGLAVWAPFFLVWPGLTC